MTDPGSDSRSAFDRRKFLTIAGAAGISTLAGCDGDGTAGDTPSETATDTPTETATETDTPTETPTDTPTETEVEPAAENGPFAEIPAPAGDDVERPSGDAGNLEVLDWAGFESAVTYTFDDSQPSHVAHYDELEATGVDMTFYVSANVGASEDGWTQAVEDGHELGNHTLSHPHDDLSGSSFGEPEDSLAAEIEGCSEYITETLGQGDVWTFAAPFGEGGWTEPARESDLFLNRGVGGGTVAPGEGRDPYNLSCYMATEGETADAFNDEIDSARSDGEWLILLFHSITPTDQEWYAPVDIGEITGSVEHAQSYDDVWVDTVANVGAYWRGQQILESATAEESGEETTWTWTVPEDYPSHQTVRVTVDGGTLSQNGTELEWDSNGYYEVALDEESLTLAP